MPDLGRFGFLHELQLIVLELLDGDGGRFLIQLDESEIGLLIDEAGFLGGHDDRLERGEILAIAGFKGQVLVLGHWDSFEALSGWGYYSWQREGDSNPRGILLPTCFPSMYLKPLGHLSIRLKYRIFPAKIKNSGKKFLLEADHTPLVYVATIVSLISFQKGHIRRNEQ
jgi:hypothetical protein